MSNGQLEPPEKTVPLQQLQRTPADMLVPIEEALPGGNPPQDPFGALLPYIAGPMDAYGKRTLAQNVTLPIMMEMQYDETVTLGMAQLTSLLVESEWTIECADPMIRRWFHQAYEPLHRKLILAASPALFFGFSPMMKKMDWKVPEPDAEGPVWTRTETPLIVTGVRQFHVENATPLFDEENHFAGIEVLGEDRPVPVMYSLWISIGKHRVFGDYRGWGRAYNVYKPWWKKNFVDDHETLWVSKGVSPGSRVRHPAGKTRDGRSYRDIAAAVGDAMGANKTITLPSTQYPIRDPETGTERPSGEYMWDAEYYSNESSIDGLLDIKTDQDRRILMGLYWPPEGLLKPVSQLGGMNTAQILGDIAEDTLLTDAGEIDEHINEYIFPQMLHWNFGPDAPTVRKRTTKMSRSGRARMEMIFDRLITRSDVDATIFDMQAIGRQLDIPMQQGMPPAPEPPTPQPTPIATPPVTPPAAPQASQTGVPVPAQQSALREPHNGAQRVNRITLRSGIVLEYESPEQLGDLLSELLPGLTPDPGNAADPELPPENELAAIEDDPALSDAALTFLENAVITDGEAEVALLVAREYLREARGFSVRRLFATGSAYEQALAKIAARVQDEIESQLRAFQNGNAPGDTVRRMGASLRKGALEVAQLGLLERDGDDAQAMSVSEREKVQAWYEDQQKYLRGVYQVMRDTLDAYPVTKNDPNKELREQAINALVVKLREWRMPLYVSAMRSEFERTRARWTLKKWPRSGATSCIVNCQCSLDWRKEDGEQVVYWKLGTAEHCEDCLALAEASPYKQGEL